MRKYWICFKVMDGKNSGDGWMEITRDLSIRGEADLREIGVAIKKSLGEQLPPTANLQVISWQAFEEECIIRANGPVPPLKQSPQISLSH